MNSHLRTDSNSQICECCGNNVANLVYERIPFLYGHGKAQVTLEADMPIWRCIGCDEGYTAEGAEEAERDAICAHLGRLRPRDILEARLKAGLSQEAFAKSLGKSVGRVSVNRWEQGQQLQSAVYDDLIRAWIAKRSEKSSVYKPGRFRTDVAHRRPAADAFMLAAA